MEATLAEPLIEDDVIESSTEIPNPEDYVPCDQCDSTVRNGVVASTRSYMFYLYKDGLLCFCKHHGEKNQEKLESLGASLVLDTRDQLIENRLKGQP